MAGRKSDSILPTLDDLFSIQESQILPSEKAFAYKMRLGAMKRQGQRTDLIYLLIEKGACHSAVNPKVWTKINIKLLENEFGIAPDSFLLILRKFYRCCSNECILPTFQ